MAQEDDDDVIAYSSRIMSVELCASHAQLRAGDAQLQGAHARHFEWLTKVVWGGDAHMAGFAYTWPN